MHMNENRLVLKLWLFISSI